MAEHESALCSNLGCGQRFSRADNSASACVHHPGAPFFHDAYKGWSCCGQKSTDFTTFLAFKGCTRGPHSDVKRAPPEPRQPEPEPEQKVERADSPERPWDDQFVDLEVRETPDCQQTDQQPPAARVCRKCGKGASEAEGACVYHVGQTIFHETLKYWTCCPHKKFTDFDDFRAFPGCQQDHVHELHVPKQAPRVDAFQSQTHAHLVLYGLKGARASTSHVRCNGRRVEAVFCDSSGATLFEGAWDVRGRVDKHASVVRVRRNKAEVELKKWKNNEFWEKVF